MEMIITTMATGTEYRAVECSRLVPSLPLGRQTFPKEPCLESSLALMVSWDMPVSLGKFSRVRKNFRGVELWALVHRDLH